MDIQNTIINTLIVSIPEEFFIAVLILILLGRWDFLENLDKIKLRGNLFKIMIISAIPMAIISDTIKYLKVDDTISLFTGIILTSISIIILTEEKKIKIMFKILLITFLGFVIFCMTELFTLFISRYGLHINLDYINSYPMINFIMLIPERILQYGFLFIIYLKANSLSKINLFELIFKNRVIRNLTIIMTCVDMAILCWALKYLVFLNILKDTPVMFQLFNMVIVLSVAFINIMVIWIASVYINSTEKYIQKYHKYE